MEKKHKYYFKVLNDELFGGEGSEGYMSLACYDKNDNPVEIVKSALYLTKYSSNVEVIEISEEEYLKATEEDQ